MRSGKNFDMEWVLSIARLIERTNRDQARVGRPVSPRMVFRPQLTVIAPRPSKPFRRR
jgi:hypothetical protein